MQDFNTVDEYVEALNNSITQLESQVPDIQYNYKQIYDCIYNGLELIRDLFDITKLRYMPESDFDELGDPDEYDWSNTISDKMLKSLYDAYDDAYKLYKDGSEYAEALEDLYDDLKEILHRLPPPTED